MSAKSVKRYAAQIEKATKKANPAAPLPQLPEGMSEKEFGARRQAQNARARLAGYENYNEWLKARKEVGADVAYGRNRTRDNVEVQRKRQYRDRQVYKFDFKPEARNADERYKRLENELQDLVMNAPDGMIVQLFIKGNVYGGVADRLPTDWDFVSRLPENVSDLKKEIGGRGVLDFLRESFNVRDYDEKNRGVAEIQVAFYKGVPNKGEHIQGRKGTRK